MNLNEYIKQTESEFDEIWGGYDPKSDTKGLDYKLKSFIKTRIERGVELAFAETRLHTKLVEPELSVGSEYSCPRQYRFWGYNNALVDQEIAKEGFLETKIN